jgi:hypothetical protein
LPRRAAFDSLKTLPRTNPLGAAAASFALCGLVCLSAALRADVPFSQDDARAVLRKSCAGCHQGREASGKLDLSKFGDRSVATDERAWRRILARVRDSEMPPANAPPLAIDVRDKFTGWIERSLIEAACAGGVPVGPWPVRRLNRSEYAATVRDLLNVHYNAGHSLPGDGAGGEGFDNAAETLFLSPVHAERYLDAARQALEYGAADTRARARFLNVQPDEKTTEDEAAKKLLEAFLPRAFRRPVDAVEVERFQSLFRSAKRRGEKYDNAILYALQAVLISPHFLFRIEDTNAGPEPRLAPDYALASRLSYFLWGTMPDDALFDLAAKGKLQDEETLKTQVVRLLKDQRATDFAENFVEQWLGTRELGRDIKPDPMLFPDYYDAEIQSAIRYEPILFFREILVENLSILNLIDSDFTVLTNRLARHYKLQIKGMKQNPLKAKLPEGSRRGGLVTMAAIHALTSYPHRTSPVLRGKWLLDALLGTPPPPPPPDVPQLPEPKEDTEAKTVRERLAAHRDNPVCASCHDRIDPLGFGLENFDVLGNWRSEESGRPIDSTGQLPDGTVFEGPEGLKKVLLLRKDLFVRNLTAKLLAYALGRGLTLEDHCTIDRIVRRIEQEDYAGQALVREIVLSVPFRYQRGADRKLGLRVREVSE